MPDVDADQCDHAGEADDQADEAAAADPLAGRDVMRSTKRRKKIVERVIIGQVNGRQLHTYFTFVAVKQIVVSDGEIENIPRGDTRRIAVIILRVRRRDLDQRRGESRRRAVVRQRPGRSCRPCQAAGLPT